MINLLPECTCRAGLAGKSQGKPQFFDEIPVAASIPATVGTALFPQYEEETLHAQSDEAGLGSPWIQIPKKKQRQPENVKKTKT